MSDYLRCDRRGEDVKTLLSSCTQAMPVLVILLDRVTLFADDLKRTYCTLDIIQIVL